MHLTCCICVDSIGESGGNNSFDEHFDIDFTPTKAFERACTIPCGHVFHNRCLRGWLNGGESTTCPRCRAKFAGKQIVKLFLIDDSSPEIVRHQIGMKWIHDEMKKYYEDIRQQSLINSINNDQLCQENLKLKYQLDEVQKECQSMKERLQSLLGSLDMYEGVSSSQQPTTIVSESDVLAIDTHDLLSTSQQPTTMAGEYDAPNIVTPGGVSTSPQPPTMANEYGASTIEKHERVSVSEKAKSMGSEYDVTNAIVEDVEVARKQQQANVRRWHRELRKERHRAARLAREAEHRHRYRDRISMPELASVDGTQSLVEEELWPSPPLSTVSIVGDELQRWSDSSSDDDGKEPSPFRWAYNDIGII